MAKTANILLCLVLFLAVWGLIMVASASSVISQENYHNVFYLFFHQLIFGFIPGIIFLFLFQKIEFHIWSKLALPILLLSIFLMGLTFIPQFSYNYGGARRWLHIAHFSLQPSEILKITLIFYLASWIKSKKDKIKSWQQGVLPFGAIVLLSGLFILKQPDFSTFLILFFTSSIMFFVGGGRFSHISSMSTVIVVALLLAMIFFSPVRLARIKTFLNPHLDPQGSGYQIRQSLIAIGSGEITGRGLGKSIQKYNYLPEPAGDSIFAILSEDLGFLGSSTVVALYSLLAYFAFKAAAKIKDEFGKLVIVGITSLILIQAFINISSVAGIFPFTGVTLPFISYGGTSLAILMAAMGIVINIIRTTKI